MTPLFGRHTELALLDRAVARALTGQPAFAVVEGEAGIGKTAVLREMCRRAGERGFTVFSGGAAELTRDRPFVAIAEALGCRFTRRVRRGVSSRSCSTENGRSCSAICRCASFGSLWT